METVSTELKEGTTLTSRQIENIGRMVERIKRKSFKMEFECPPPFISPDVTAMTEYDKSWPFAVLVVTARSLSLGKQAPCIRHSSQPHGEGPVKMDRPPTRNQQMKPPPLGQLSGSPCKQVLQLRPSPREFRRASQLKPHPFHLHLGPDPQRLCMYPRSRVCWS